MDDTTPYPIKNLIFIKDTPFSLWDYQRLGIDLLKKNGLSVEIWDITKVIHPRVPTIENPLPAPMTSPRVFSKKRELFKSLTGLNQHDSAILMLVPFTYRSYSIYRTLSQRSIFSVVLFLNVVPASECRRIREKSLASIPDFFKKLFYYPKLRLVETAVDLFLLRHYKTFGVKAVDVCLLGGKESAQSIPYPIDDSTHLFWGHAFDYDIYLDKIKEKLEKPIRPYAVFIDQYLPFQVIAYNNDVQVCDPDKYYPSLCRFFTKLEENLKIPVKIAAHPCVPDIAQYSIYFRGREVIPGDTAGLIQQSDLVLVHASTATNYAILFDKPVLFLTTNELENTYVKQYIESVACELGKVSVNVDEPADLDIPSIYSVDPVKYQAFREKYIKTAGSGKDYLWQLVADYLKNPI
jgi:hypothetical protein